VPKSNYHAKCSQCALGFRADNKKDLLNKVRNHMWRKHADWMKRKIKQGLKKRRSAYRNPHLQQALLAGVFPPATIPSLVTQYKAMSPSERNLVRNMVTALTVPVGGEASAIAAVTLKALDIAVEGV
jgi:hypothetical protein